MHFCDPPPEPTPQGNGIPRCRVATRFFALFFGSLFFTVFRRPHLKVDLEYVGKTASTYRRGGRVSNFN